MWQVRLQSPIGGDEQQGDFLEFVRYLREEMRALVARVRALQAEL
jgi:hypothetical protein